MDIRSYGSGEWIKAPDVMARPATLTIASISETEFADQRTGKKKKQPVLHFNGTEKKFGVNITNGNLIGDFLGYEMDAWIGKQIMLYADRCESFGEIVDCVRCRPPMMAGATPLTTAAPAQQPAVPPSGTFAGAAPAAAPAPAPATHPGLAPPQIPPNDEIPF